MLIPFFTYKTHFKVQTLQLLYFPETKHKKHSNKMDGKQRAAKNVNNYFLCVIPYLNFQMKGSNSYPQKPYW